jgi:hypothetical protein
MNVSGFTVLFSESDGLLGVSRPFAKARVVNEMIRTGFSGASDNSQSESRRTIHSDGP